MGLFGSVGGHHSGTAVVMGLVRHRDSRKSGRWQGILPVVGLIAALQQQTGV